MIFVDSNILIDIFTRDKHWVDWSQSAIADACEHNSLAINQIVVAEVAPRIGTLDQFLTWLAPFDIKQFELGADAAYCSGKAFLNYRERRKATPEIAKSIIADFLIGGHAETLGATILTRDPRFYRTYFPSVPLITPDKAET